MIEEVCESRTSQFAEKHIKFHRAHFCSQEDIFLLNKNILHLISFLEPYSYTAILGVLSSTSSEILEAATKILLKK